MNQKILRLLENNKTSTFHIKDDPRLYTARMDNGLVKITTENCAPFFCTFGVLPLFLDSFPCHLLSEDDVVNLKVWNKVGDFVSSIPELRLNMNMKLLGPPKTEVIEGSPAGMKWYGENFPSEGDFLLITPVERRMDFCTYGTVEYRCHGVDCYNEYHTFEEFKDILDVFVKESRLFEESKDMELFEKSVQETEF